MVLVTETDQTAPDQWADAAPDGALKRSRLCRSSSTDWTWTAWPKTTSNSPVPRAAARGRRPWPFPPNYPIAPSRSRRSICSTPGQVARRTGREVLNDLCETNMIVLRGARPGRVAQPHRRLLGRAFLVRPRGKRRVLLSRRRIFKRHRHSEFVTE